MIRQRYAGILSAIGNCLPDLKYVRSCGAFALCADILRFCFAAVRPAKLFYYQDLYSMMRLSLPFIGEFGSVSCQPGQGRWLESDRADGSGKSVFPGDAASV